MNLVKRFYQQFKDLSMSECHPRSIPAICKPITAFLEAKSGDTSTAPYAAPD